MPSIGLRELNRRDSGGRNCRVAAATRHARCHAAPGMPGGPADLVPVPSSPTRTARSGLTAIKVIDQQNLYLLIHTRLLLSPAWRWHISLARPDA